MKTCATCRRWDRSEDYGEQASQGLGRCRATMQWWDACEWKESGGDYTLVLRPEFAHVTAFAKDGSDYRATLYTMPEHGCTMHVARDGNLMGPGGGKEHS